MPKAEPKPRRGVSPCPDHMTGYAAEAWARLSAHLDGMGVLTLVDDFALEALCGAYSDWRECRDQVADEGRTVERTNKSGHTSTFANPVATQLSDAWRRYTLMLPSFGLTPADRSKVSAETVTEEDPLDELIGRRTA